MSRDDADDNVVTVWENELRRTSFRRCLTVLGIQLACIIEGASRRGSGGIGRRASLRSWWPKGRRGSSPFFRRKIRRSNEARLVDARQRLPYTGNSPAVNASRTSLPRFSDRNK